VQAGERPKERHPVAAFLTVAAICGVLVFPAALVLWVAGNASHPARLSNTRAIPGYTVSLLLFLSPVGAISCWFFRRSSRVDRLVFYQSLTLLVSIGLVLDFVFGRLFFNWPNVAAVSGLAVPAVGGPLPIEEVIFFVSGFSFLLLTYIWSDQHWLAAYHRSASSSQAIRIGQWIGVIPVALSIATLTAAIAYKRFISTHPHGFPGYLCYVMIVAVIPPAICFPRVMALINWQAFSFTQLVMVLICLFWEVTLAVPNQWWSFRPEMMTGIYIRAWSNLPIEEPLVWFASTFTVVVTYEFLKLRRSASESIVRNAELNQ